MIDKPSSAERSSDLTGQVARDLRTYADAGMDPLFAAKLRAIAAELDVLTGTRKIKAG